MLEGNARGWKKALGIELCAWVALIATFSCFYVLRFDAPWAAMGAHLLVLSGPLASLLGLRMLVWRSCLPPVGKTVLVTCLLAAPLLAALVFYAVALLGLSSWGRVTTWALVVSYGAQLAHLLDILAIPAWVLPLAATLVLAATAWAIARWWTHRDWARHAVLGLSRTLALVVPVALVVGGALQTWRFSVLSAMSEREPLGLAFIPQRGATTRQHHSVGDTHLIDAEEARSRSGYKTAPTPPTRNVILIIGDALRADHMGVYGYPRDTTPFLSRLGNEGKLIRVDRARSVCAESTCGLLGIATSRPIHRLPYQPFTLHEALRLHGYRVHLVLGGDHTNFYGLKQAYGPVDSYFDGNDQRDHYINDDSLVVQHLQSLPPQPAAQPTLFQFHLMSTHGLGQREQSHSPFQPSSNYYSWVSRSPEPESRTALAGINYYDNGMRSFDYRVEQLLTQLGEKGYLRDALVVITGDHGEELGEHGYFGHARQVNEQVLTIPLLFIRYGYTGQALYTQPLATQLDIAPTILQELGVPQPSTWSGLPLQHAIPPRMIPFQQAKQAGVYNVSNTTKVLKYGRDLRTGHEFLFSIDDDPAERHNRMAGADATQLRSWRRAVMAAGLVIGEEDLDFDPPYPPMSR